MKALRLHEYGDIQNVVLEDIPMPKPGPTEVLVRVAAASTNPLDVKLLSGIYRDKFPLALPYVVGVDLAGTVVEVGPLLSGWKEGDRVIGRFEPNPGMGHEYGRIGAFAEYVVIPARHLAQAPVEHPLANSAGLPTAAGTAWQALFEVGNLQPCQSVLIHAAAGGVGHFAVQMAKVIGAHVIATTSTSNHTLVRELGADRLIDYRTEDFSESLRDIDLVLDTIGGDTQLRSYKVLRPGGVLASITAPPDSELAKQHQVSAVRVGYVSDGSRLNLISSLVDSGKLRIIVDQVFSLTDARAALTRAASGHSRGKIIITT